MNPPPEEKWEMRVERTARSFPYPDTPDIAGSTRAALHPQRQVRHTWRRAVAVIVLALLAAMLFVPEIRAGVLEFLRIGAVRIFVGESTDIPTNIPGTLSLATVEASNATLADAERALGVLIQLPTYPSDLGTPDAILVNDDRVAVISLVWYMPETETMRLVLQMIGSDIDVVKYGLDSAQQVSVNREPAVWLEAPHFIEMFDHDGRAISGVSWLIQSHVLVWTDARITYRLETDQPLAEALRIAESLNPVNGG